MTERSAPPLAPALQILALTPRERTRTLFRRIFLVDCPGVVYDVGDDETNTVLKGVVRVENLLEPTLHIAQVLDRVKLEYLQKTYGVTAWTDVVDFLGQIAHKSGRLLKGGEPDLNIVARRVLSDWQRGKIPWFTPPPDSTEFLAKAAASGAAAADGAPRIAQLFSHITVNPDLGFDAADLTRAATDDDPMDANITDWDKVYKDKIESDSEDDDALELEFPEDDDAPLVMTTTTTKGSQKLAKQARAQSAAASVAGAASARPNKRKAASSPAEAVSAERAPRSVERPSAKRPKLVNVAPAAVAASAAAAAAFEHDDGDDDDDDDDDDEDEDMPDRHQLKKMKKKMAKKAHVERNAHLQLPKYENSRKEGAGKVDYNESAADRAFWNHKSGIKDLNKLNTMRPKPSAPLVRYTNEKTQKRISLNRRKTRLCV